MNYAVGIDIGGTKIAFALVNRQGHVIAEHRIPMQTNVPANEMISHIVDGVSAVRGDVTIDGIGIGSPGHIDPINGIVLNAVNLGWLDVLLVDAIKNQLELSVYLEMDVRAALVGEVLFGAAQSKSDVVQLAIGTGLGGAALTGGKLVTGSRFFAMELGHLILPGNDRLCNCGQVGCVETILSGRGVTLAMAAYRDQFPETLLTSTANAHDWLLAVHKNDPLALYILNEVRDVLLQLCQLSMVVFNPQQIILSGGFGEAIAGLLLDDLHKTLRTRTLHPLHDQIEIMTSQLASSAVGAAGLVWYNA